jgi:3-methyladenine DNA glycosylase AlkD
LKKIPKNGFAIEDIHALEHFIVTKSWWDTVDLIASNAVGRYMLQFPEKRDTTIDHWRKSDNIWLNRSCLIFQLKYKDQTNFKLLKSLIQQYQFENEFFIQKAIGWSLREYSKTNPEGVRDFIEAIGLKGLAYREGGKYL